MNIILIGSQGMNQYINTNRYKDFDIYILRSDLAEFFNKSINTNKILLVTKKNEDKFFIRDMNHTIYECNIVDNSNKNSQYLDLFTNKEKNLYNVDFSKFGKVQPILLMNESINLLVPSKLLLL